MEKLHVLPHPGIIAHLTVKREMNRIAELHHMAGHIDLMPDTPMSGHAMIQPLTIKD